MSGMRMPKPLAGKTATNRNGEGCWNSKSESKIPAGGVNAPLSFEGIELTVPVDRRVERLLRVHRENSTPPSHIVAM